MTLRGAVLAAACAVAAAPAGAAGLPDPAAIQAAYEAAKQDAAGRHIDDLAIEAARCAAAADARVQCQVDFQRTTEATGRLYFDVVALRADGDRWVLLSGLCRRPADRSIN